MRIILAVVAVLLSMDALAATGGGKGKASFGASADSGHGSPGAGGGGGTSITGNRAMYRDPRSAPPLVEKRKVNEQDCSKPVDMQAGNLRCK
jgi:hypothetical protein